jgi:hypothetical protein
VQCATGYKIYQRLGDAETGEDLTTETTHALKEAFENLAPCENYFYAVSTLVAEQVQRENLCNKTNITQKYFQFI